MANIKEKITFIDNDAENEIYVTKEYEEELPVIHFPNSLTRNTIYNTEYLQNLYLDVDEYIYYNGGSFIEPNKQINRFIIKYIQIKEVFQKGLIDKNVFHDIINSYLEGLSKKPIEFFKYDDEWDTDEIPEIEEGEELPFEPNFDPDFVKEIRQTRRDSLKLENAIAEFATNNNITFIEQPQDDDK